MGEVNAVLYEVFTGVGLVLMAIGLTLLCLAVGWGMFWLLLAPVFSTVNGWRDRRRRRRLEKMR